jgi:hypothetical protein
MKTIRKRIQFSIWSVSCCSLLLIIAGCHKKKDPPPAATNLLPAPQKIKKQKGITLKPQNVKTIYLYAEAGKKDRFAAHLLQGKIDSLFGRKISVQKVRTYKNISRPAIVLGIPSADQEFANFCSGLNLPSPKKNAKQSYVLNIDKNLITVLGGGKAGLFYGIQTLNQLLEDAKWDKTPLQGSLIQDWPDLKNRWVQFDESFHLDRYDYLKKAIAKLSRYKVNGVVFEFQDKFDYKKYPVIAAPHSMTPQQVKELTLYAHKYHIAIIPLVQGLGHAFEYLKHPQFKELRADPNSPWAFNPLKKETYKLQFDLYNETIKATPGVKYYHVGGDEVRFTGNNPQLQAYKKKHGPFSLYLLWLNKVSNYMTQHDRKMIFWDDMPLKIAGIWRLMYPTKMSSQKLDSTLNQGFTKLDSVINKFPKNAIYTQWSYDNTSKGNVHVANARLIDWFKKHNIKDLSATAAQNTRPLIPSYKKKPANIKSFVTLSAKKHVFGEFCTAWDDSGLHFATFWMGFLASADYGWNYKKPASLRQYWSNYLYRFFGPDTKGLYKVFHNLSKRVHFWNTAIMKKGTKQSYREKKKDQQLINLPSLQNVPSDGSWSKQYESLMKKAKVEKRKNAQAIKTLEENMDKVKRNAYNLKVFESMGRFMKADANLVLSIGKIAKYADKARAAQKNQSSKVAANLDKMAAIADSAWNGYKASYDHMKKVWQVSRYPKGGKGYVLYKFGHFASRRADLSYLIMAEEGLDLPGYAKKLRGMADRYKEK